MTVNSNEYKQHVGLDSLYIAEITQDDASAYIAGTPEYLAPVATAKATPKVDTQTSYFDDQAYETIDAEGPTDLEIEISNLPAEMYAKILGQEFDSVNGRVLDEADPAQAPYFAFGFRAKKANGSYRYYWFSKIRFSRPDEEYATQADKADAKTVTFKAQALKTIFKFTYPSAEIKSCKRVWGDEDTDNFSATTWFDAVQTPTSASPSALTCTPVPADNASGVSGTADITLTFNNRIRSGNTGIMVTKSDGTAVAAAYSWNVAGTVLTINPDASLSGTYLITLAGVTDVYGQTLDNTAYNFSTGA